MGRAAKREHLSRIVESHAQTIQETLQMFEAAASSSTEKIDWSQVLNMADDVSKQATITGMLWSGETPNMAELEENVAVFGNVLQGFLLLSHSSTVGAGSTLLSCVHASAKKVTESSLALLRGVVSFYGIPGKKSSIPKLSGAVWEACASLKKVPTSNHVAIGRSITQVAISVKDVLRELRELKPAETSAKDESEFVNETCEDDNLTDDEFGNDLSPEEMDIAGLVIGVVSDTLTVIKELMHFVTGLLKCPNSKCGPEELVDSLERLLKYCQDVGGEVDDLGACVYPPQEAAKMEVIAKKMMDFVNNTWKLITSMTESSAEGMKRSLDQLQGSLMQLKSRVSDCQLMGTETEKMDSAA